MIFKIASHIVASGWVLASKKHVEKNDILKVRIENFYNVATNTGMYWLSFTMKDRSVVEFSVNNYEIVENVKKYVSKNLPNADVVFGQRV